MWTRPVAAIRRSRPGLLRLLARQGARLPWTGDLFTTTSRFVARSLGRPDSPGARISMAPRSIELYRRILCTTLEAGGAFVTLREILSGGGEGDDAPRVVLRRDIDFDPSPLASVAAFEEDLEIRTVVFVRADGITYDSPPTSTASRLTSSPEASSGCVRPRTTARTGAARWTLRWRRFDPASGRGRPSSIPTGIARSQPREWRAAPSRSSTSRAACRRSRAASDVISSIPGKLTHRLLGLIGAPPETPPSNDD